MDKTNVHGDAADDHLFQRCFNLVSSSDELKRPCCSRLWCRSFYLEPVYRIVPIFKPFLMAALLVGFLPPPPRTKILSGLPQIFKIVAPYVILSAIFATLNARLHLPPFSLFIVALTLTDGGSRWHFRHTMIINF
jgi:hypothetical protein